MASQKTLSADSLRSHYEAWKASKALVLVSVECSAPTGHDGGFGETCSGVVLVGNKQMVQVEVIVDVEVVDVVAAAGCYNVQTSESGGTEVMRIRTIRRG